MFHLFRTLYEIEAFRKFLKIYIQNLYLRKILTDIQIQRHAGTDTVTVRSDMSGNGCAFYIFQF